MMIKHRSSNTFGLSGCRYRRYSTWRSYKEAVETLNTIQTNFSVIDALRKSGRGMNKQAIPEMLEWLRRAGYQAHDLNALNAIHVAGTKGKGSTAAFVASILNQYRRHDPDSLIKNVGLYTSPHLRFVRERIQINGQPITETAFAESFFELWDRFEQAQRSQAIPLLESAQRPVYFRYLTIMAFHTYLKENVDAAVIECGIGGEYDSTNILTSPTVTGITSLGLDHLAVLGSTMEEIAWHKAGIMKTGVSAFTSPQPKEAMDVLFSRAKERGAALKIVDVHPEIASGQAVLGLNGDFQKLNASMAVELAAEFLRRRGKLDINTRSLPLEFQKGLKDVKWGGRCEIRRETNLNWYIDGAHTLESIRVTGQWYSSTVNSKTSNVNERTPRILLFNQQTRAGLPLIKELHAIVVAATMSNNPFTHAIFCTNVTYATSGYRPDLVSMNVDESIVKGLKVQKEFANGWQDIAGADDNQISVLPTIEEAVKRCRDLCETWHERNPGAQDIPTVLATGSIHLIGGLLDVLEEFPG